MAKNDGVTLALGMIGLSLLIRWYLKRRQMRQLTD